MKRFKTRKTLAVAAAALVVVGGGGAALAAQGSSSPGQSFLDSVAKHLGISSQELEDATKAAAIDQVDQALADGRITEEQAQQFKDRIESGDAPPFFGPFFGRFPHPGIPLFGERLSAAADYLGLAESELREKLNDGQTLAEVAKAEGKSVDGLEAAIVADATQRVDQLVEDGELTQAQADEMLERMKSHVDDLVENGMFRFRTGHGPGPREHPFW